MEHDEISEAAAEAYLTDECRKVSESVSGLVGSVALTQNQFDALVSFAYNVGVGALRGSTLLKNLLDGDLAGAAEQFECWNKATTNGAKCKVVGLTTRRLAERRLFEQETDQGEPMSMEVSPQEKATLLMAFRDGDLNVIVAKDSKDNTVEILELDSNDIDALGALLRTYPNAAKFRIAAAADSIPAGDRTRFVMSGRRDLPSQQLPQLHRDLLERGSKDAETLYRDVEDMQRRLEELGYYRGEMDGVFGRGTDTAVRAFQSNAFGRAGADGKVGPRTWARLFGADGPPPVEPEGPRQEGLNYLRLTKTDQRDEKGLVSLDLAYYKDGRLQGSIPACSGQPKHQFFKNGKDSQSGSFEPLPEGRWTISSIRWKDGRDNFNGKVWSGGLGPVKIPMCYKEPGRTHRGSIEIHMDWNRTKSPGTSGCIGILTKQDFQCLVGWLRDTDPRSLYVDWGLDTCPKPKAPEATSDEKPCTW